MSEPVVINPSWCKGCRLCVEFCPDDVLTLHRAKCVVEVVDNCTGCRTCERICPDFAIRVYPEFAKGKKKKGVA
jgi:NAD-dependent dihydropyrimidine dehydrogenase PreA subunit